MVLPLTGLNLQEGLGKVVPFLPFHLCCLQSLLLTKSARATWLRECSCSETINLVCSDLLSVENALQILDDFGDISGL